MKQVQYLDKKKNEVLIGILTPEGDLLCDLEGKCLIESHNLGKDYEILDVIVTE